MKRKILSVLLTLCMLAAFLPCGVSAEEKKYGNLLFYEINENGDGVTITDCDEGAEGKMEIPDKIENLPVTSIGNEAFQDCASLTSINIPNSVTSIGEYAFDFCASLQNISIPNSVTSIGDYAFFFCINLQNISIPSSVTNIGWNVFADCGRLNISVVEDNPKFCAIDGVLFSKDKTEIIAYAKEDIQSEYIIPYGTVSIRDYGFSRCDSLTSITIPDTIANIGEEAFRDCASLTSINIPNNITNIGAGAFNSLVNITIGNGITAIKENTFCGCGNLTSVVIPNGVTSIDNYAFIGCDGLRNIDIPTSVTRIGNQAFCGCKSLTVITLPGSITSIGDMVFDGCDRLTDIYFDGSETQWNNIDIGDFNNETLFNATIHYGRYDPITPAALTVTPSGNGYVLTADTDYDGVAYAASYDADGVLLNVVSKPFTNGMATVTPDTTGAAKIKFFVWTNTLQPVTLAKTIDL